MIYYESDSIKLINSDCLEALKTMDDNSVDSIVSDPPSGIGFMNSEWDSDKGGRKQWIDWMTQIMSEALRVVKPGGHILIWAIPRTSHWTATAIEDAGFEIRDKIHHIYGSGWPKNMDISKSIDKSAGATREVVGFDKSKHRANSEKNHQDGQSGRFGLKAEGTGIITAAATGDAKIWEGWGTALKPAVEEWVLARKPISEKTVAKNVLKHGTGAINIVASRVDSFAPGEFEKLSKRAETPRNVVKGGNFTSAVNDHPQDIIATSMSPEGRWPANIVLSHSADCTDELCSQDCPIRLMNEQSGNRKGQYCPKTSDCGGNTWPGSIQTNRGPRGYDDDGGASRYFQNFKVDDYVPFYYASKPSNKERDAGLKRNRFQTGTGSEENNHPTVKSLSLMKYLVTLITPPNGTVLDMFMGSGSTGCAASICGFNFIGIELEKDYCDIAKKRIIYWKNKI